MAEEYKTTQELDDEKIEKEAKELAEKEKERALRAEKHAGLAHMGWDQSFLISYLKYFLDARLEIKEKLGFGQGNYVAIRGGIDDFIGAMQPVQQDVEALSLLNSAQLASLVPYVRIIRVPTATLLEENPGMLEKPIHFYHNLDPKVVPAITYDASETWSGLTLTGGIAPTGAGIKDINIKLDQTGAGNLGPPKSSVDVTFEFDSLQTFIRNQRTGLSFLELIPTSSSRTRTGGTTDVLWDLKLIVGWSKPSDGAAALFVDPPGQRAMARIGDMKIVMILTLPEKHNFEFADDGSVKLTLTYKPATADIQGIEAQQRSDILPPPPHGSMLAAAYHDARAEIHEELRLTRTAYKKMHAAVNESRTKLELAKKTQREAEKKLKKRLEFARLNEAWWNPASWGADENPQAVEVFTSYDEYTAAGGSEMDPDLDEVAKGAKSKESAHEWRLRLEEELEEHYAEHDKKLSDARFAAAQEYANAGEKMTNAYDVIERHHAALEELKEDRFLLEAKYSAFIKKLHKKGQLYFVDISKKDLHDYSRFSNTWANNHLTKQLKFGAGSGGLGISAAVAKGTIEDIKKASGSPNNASKIEEAINFYLKDVMKVYDDADASVYSATSARKGTQKKESGPIDKAFFKKNAKRVYYFYLGDLLGMVMDFYYENSAAPEGVNDDPGNKKSRFNSHSLMLGDFYFLEGKKKIRCHFGDFPVALPTFTKFFTERYVQRNVTTISLEEFLRDIVDYLFGPDSEINRRKTTKEQSRPKINLSKDHDADNRWYLKYAKVHSATKFERGREQEILVQGFYDLDVIPWQDFHLANKLATSSKSSSSEKKEGKALLAAMNKDKAERLQGAFGVQGLKLRPPNELDKKHYVYYMIGPKENKGSEKPQFTIWAGTDTSIIKSMKFDQSGTSKRVKQKNLMDKAQHAGGSRKAKVFAPSAGYKVSLECVGSPFFKPGQVFRFDTGFFGHGGLTIGSEQEAYEAEPEYAFESLGDILPQFLIVNEVEHHIADGDFSTSVKCTVSTRYDEGIITEDSDAIAKLVGKWLPPKKPKKKKPKSKKKPASEVIKDSMEALGVDTDGKPLESTPAPETPPGTGTVLAPETPSEAIQGSGWE